MVLGLDLDEVLLGFLPAFTQFHNEVYGTRLVLEDYSCYRFWEILGVSKEEGLGRMDNFYRTEHFRGIRPLGGAVEGVRELRKEGELVVITSRPEWIRGETESSLERYFPGQFREVCFSRHISAEGDKKGKTKSEICLEGGIKVLVDDCLDYVLECAGKGIKVVMMDCPYNRVEELPEGVRRVYDWKGVLEAVRELRKS